MSTGSNTASPAVEFWGRSATCCSTARLLGGTKWQRPTPTSAIPRGYLHMPPLGVEVGFGWSPDYEVRVLRYVGTWWLSMRPR